MLSVYLYNIHICTCILYKGEPPKSQNYLLEGMLFDYPLTGFPL